MVYPLGQLSQTHTNACVWRRQVFKGSNTMPPLKIDVKCKALLVIKLLKRLEFAVRTFITAQECRVCCRVFVQLECNSMPSFSPMFLFWIKKMFD